MENQGPTGGLTPHIAIADKRGAEAIEFYVKAFGASRTGYAQSFSAPSGWR